jgi:hypothetical protein
MRIATASHFVFTSEEADGNVLLVAQPQVNAVIPSSVFLHLGESKAEGK